MSPWPAVSKRSSTLRGCSAGFAVQALRSIDTRPEPKASGHPLPIDSSPLSSFTHFTSVAPLRVCVYYLIVTVQRYSNGGGGIRTPETLTGLTVFKTVAFNHSATPPH